MSKLLKRYELKPEDPASGRVQIYENGNQLQFRVDSESQIFFTLFVSFWLCGWAFGEIAVLGTLLSGTAGAGAIFLLAWLGAWTVGGLLALSQVLWNVAGFERLTLANGNLQIERRIPFFGRTKLYDTAHVSNVRVDGTASNGGFFGRRQTYGGLFAGHGEGMIKFDYGLRTIGFGHNLEEAEARMAVRNLEARLRAH